MRLPVQGVDFLLNEKRFSAVLFTRICFVLVLICLYLSACSPQAGHDGEAPSASPAGSTPPVESGLPVGRTASPTKEPTPTKEPVPTVDPDRPYKEVLESMTADEKLGQLLIVGCLNNEEASQMIRNHKIGGAVLFSENFETFDQLVQITKQWKEYNEGNPLPLWIAMDEEGGTVSRLPAGKTPVPGARVVGSHEDVRLTKSTGTVIGRELAAAGANLDFAPVVDIVDNPENQFMLKRSYGSTPDMVSGHATAFLEGLRETGIRGCAKHFPGHGGTVVDSHKDMPVIPTSLEEWKRKDAVPFQTMIDAGVDMIMVGHLSYPNIDPSGLPASMSSVFLREQLRDRMGYQGLIITDAIDMKGYPQGEERKEAVVTSFLAGVDLFAIGYGQDIQLDVLEALKTGMETGRITEERIDASVMRIIKAKAGLADVPEYSLEEAKKIFGSKENRDAVSALLGN